MGLKKALEIYSTGDYEKSLFILEQEKNPSYKHLFLKGLCLLKLRRYGDAKLSFQKAVSLETEPQIYYYLGLVELHLKNPKRALNYFEKVDPKTADSLLMSAFSSFILQDKEKAIFFIKKAKDINPAKVLLFIDVLSEGALLPLDLAEEFLTLLSEVMEKR